MAGIKLQKRANDFFVSYRHADSARVVPLVDWLQRSCGLRLWFDASEGNAAMRSSELLAGAIGNARGALICLSKGWKQSAWCKNEYDAALNQQQAHDGFELVKLRMDDVDPPDWFNVSELIDLHADDVGARARLLRSLFSAVPRRFDNEQDVYLAAPWSRPSDLVQESLRALGDSGWRLVGDSPNLEHLGVHRIESIIQTTRGVVALLPHDATQLPYLTSPYILQEAEVALACGKPLLLLAEPGAQPPTGLVQSAFRSTAVMLTPGATGRQALASVLEDFDELLGQQRCDDSRAFIFLAGSLRGDVYADQELATVIERASNLRCVRGERVNPARGTAQQAIVDLIRRAAVVIADVSDDHRNTLIEAGIAMGAGTPLRLIVNSPGGVKPTRRFMFEGQEFHGYATPEDRLGLCFYFARQFRRQVYVVR